MTTESPLKRPDLHPKECRVPTQHKIDGRAGRNTPTLARRPSLREIGRSGRAGHQPHDRARRNAPTLPKEGQA